MGKPSLVRLKLAVEQAIKSGNSVIYKYKGNVFDISMGYGCLAISDTYMWNYKTKDYSKRKDAFRAISIADKIHMVASYVNRIVLSEDMPVECITAFCNRLSNDRLRSTYGWGVSYWHSNVTTKYMEGQAFIVFVPKSCI